MKILKYSFILFIILGLSPINLSLVQDNVYEVENSCGLTSIVDNRRLVIGTTDKDDLLPHLVKEIMVSEFWNINDERLLFKRFSSAIQVEKPMLQVSLANKVNNSERRRLFQYDYELTQSLLKKSRYSPGKLKEIMRGWKTKDEDLFKIIFAINHELSHFASGNVLFKINCENTHEADLRKKQELSADRVAATKCYEMGISPVFNVFRILTEYSESDCYPLVNERINAIKNSYYETFKSPVNQYGVNTFMQTSSVRLKDDLSKLVYKDSQGVLKGVRLVSNKRTLWNPLKYMIPQKMKKIGYSTFMPFYAKHQYYGIQPKAYIDTLLIKYTKGEKVLFDNLSFAHDSLTRLWQDQYTTKLLSPKAIFIENNTIDSIGNGKYEARINRNRFIYQVVDGKERFLTSQTEQNSLASYSNVDFTNPFSINFSDDSELIEPATFDKSELYYVKYYVYRLTKDETLLDKYYIDYNFSSDCMIFGLEDANNKVDSLSATLNIIESNYLVPNKTPSLENLQDIECFMSDKLRPGG